MSLCLAEQSLFWLFSPGYRHRDTGVLTNVGNNGYSWSSSVSSTNGVNLNFNYAGLNPSNANNRAYGFPVRCLQAFTRVFRPYFKSYAKPFFFRQGDCFRSMPSSRRRLSATGKFNNPLAYGLVMGPKPFLLITLGTVAARGCLFCIPGYRDSGNEGRYGALMNVGNTGNVWSSAASGTNAVELWFNSAELHPEWLLPVATVSRCGASKYLPLPVFCVITRVLISGVPAVL